MKTLIRIFFLFSLTPALSQTLLTDPTSGCRYTLPWNCDDCTMKWTGSCQDNLPNGDGVLSVFHDSTEIMNYTGEMKNGHFNGVGSYQDGMNKMRGYFRNSMLVNIDSTLYAYIEHNQISANDPTNINVSFYGSENLYYYGIRTVEEPIGALVLLPSFYEQAEGVLSNNSVLIKTAFENGLLVIVPTINHHLCLQQPAVDFLNNVFSDAIARYNIPETNFVLAGFSLGGINVLRYAELAFENDLATRIQPRAVLAVDPPVDLVSLYNREMEQLAKDSTYAEAKMVLEGIQKDIGTPTANYERFVQYSAYSRAEDQGGNLKYLKDIPVRVYCDPDINWWMENRNFSLHDINVTDISAMILKLKELGNDDAAFINALGKGYRLDGNRHPHSWSLIDPDECMDWVLSIIN
ncbi:MAG: hypothetical protein ACFHU9_00810 [Fluviicola sp.]